METLTMAKPFVELTAADLMSTPVVTIPNRMSLRDAARVLHRADIRGAPVVDDDGRCLGVLASSDFVTRTGGLTTSEELMTFVGPHGEVVNLDTDCEVCRHMTTDMVTVDPSASVRELAQKMVDAHIHRVLVVDEDYRPCGVVTTTDILAAVARC